MKRQTGPELLIYWIAIFFAFLFVDKTGYALVYYDKGREVIDGIVLLQDISNPDLYYYLPDYPRLSKNDAGDFEFMFMKYINAGGELKGAIFHALFEFDLPPEKVAELERKLRWRHFGARLIGPVPLIELDEDAAPEGNTSMKVVSSVLSMGAKGDAAPKIIASGSAPLHAGARAAVAIRLDPASASLLWEMLSSTAPDFSIAINAAYEALVTGYRARVTADKEAVQGQIVKLKETFFRRKELDSLSRRLVDQGVISVEIIDSGKGYDRISAKFDALISIITETLTESFFVYAGKDTYTLKNTRGIEKRHFSMLIDKNVTIQVPVHTSGNLGDLSALKKDSRYFFQVFLDQKDPYQKLVFLLDHETVGMFDDVFNAVSIRVRIRNNKVSEKNIIFSRDEVATGNKNKALSFPKSNGNDDSAPAFEYRVIWSLISGPKLGVPAGRDRWLPLEDNFLVLLPPFEKNTISIEPLWERFNAAGIYLATVEWSYRFGGEKKAGQPLHVRAFQNSERRQLTVYHDRGTPIHYRVIWYTHKAEIQEKRLKQLRGNLLILDPPDGLPPT